MKAQPLRKPRCHQCLPRSAGIGLGIARRLACEGARVVVSSRRQQNVDETVAALRAEGLDVVGCVCHVGNLDHIKRLVKVRVGCATSHGVAHDSMHAVNGIDRSSQASFVLAAALVYRCPAAVKLTAHKRLHLLCAAASGVSVAERQRLSMLATPCQRPMPRYEVQVAQDAYGATIDVLISNAAVNPAAGPILQMPDSAIDKILDINIKTAVLLTREVAPHMPKARVGSQPRIQLVALSMSSCKLEAICGRIPAAHLAVQASSQ